MNRTQKTPDVPGSLYYLFYEGPILMGTWASNIDIDID
ncbi:hypothetical protein GPAL_2051 [Glaciecola pallidula DSM 14239 = ACAM 615]|uniref:Uncharacterized protein n=1 Tax=Brumicola pallidula DSM 14239 = ACAM 615 TaxID=1121922 RepID=K6ZEZ1_9ALTE|nr:hypothetical protein GPAL_2051 [Glaciecola pallidula DSM 14239 = ACAM 615]